MNQAPCSASSAGANLPDQGAHLVYIIARHLLAGGQHDDSLGHGLRVWEQHPGVRLLRAIRLHAMNTGPKVLAGNHLMGVQMVDQGVAVARAHLGVYLDDDVLVVVPLGGVVVDQLDAGQPGESLSVGQVVQPVDLDDLVDRLETRQAHRGADLGHLAVGAKVDHIVEALEPEVPHEAHPLREGVVVGRDRPALE